MKTIFQFASPALLWIALAAAQPNPDAAQTSHVPGAGQHLYAGGRGRQHHRAGGQGRRAAGGYRVRAAGAEGDGGDPQAVAGPQSATSSTRTCIPITWAATKLSPRAVRRRCPSNGRIDGDQPLSIIAHENVLNRMTTAVTGNDNACRSARACPTTNTSRRSRICTSTARPSFSITSPTPTPTATASCCSAAPTWSPPATSSRPSGYPFIDLEHGGSMQGEIDALNTFWTDRSRATRRKAAPT